MAKLIDQTNKKKKKKYTDGKSKEEKMFLFAKNKNQITGKEEWVIMYHFSKFRENILNWYPFKKDCSILEIGSGCGALTEMLSRKAKRLDSIELEIDRAKINYERNKEKTNINIFVNDINSFKTNKKYDYVILIGVLEYAEYIDNSKNDPFVSLLKKAKTFLKESGTMLIAIENKYGLKYFSGTKEDHVGIPFIGINEYINTKIRTFTKNELKQICQRANCKIKKWYYPYPDYKFPFEIFTDSSINKIIPLSDARPLDANQTCLFDTKKVYKQLMKEKIMSSFANSFLLEINNSSKEKADYIKISSNRNNKYAIITKIDFRNKKVYKEALYKESFNHIKTIAKNNTKKSIIEISEYKMNKCGIVSNFIEGKPLNEILLNASKEETLTYINNIKKLLYKGKRNINKPNKKFINVFGIKTIKKELYWKKDLTMDIISSNIIIKNNKMSLIDNEWQFSFLIPAEYVLWRFMLYSPTKRFSKNEIINKILEIDEKTYNLFYKMEANFVRKYVDVIDLRYKKIKQIEI